MVSFIFILGFHEIAAVIIPLLQINDFTIVFYFFLILYLNLIYRDTHAINFSQTSIFLNFKYLKFYFYKSYSYFMYYFNSHNFIGKSIKWKPLFKKNSYFGLFRANKNQ